MIRLDGTICAVYFNPRVRVAKGFSSRGLEVQLFTWKMNISEFRNTADLFNFGVLSKTTQLHDSKN